MAAPSPRPSEKPAGGSPAAGPQGPLRGVRVVDLTDERGIYGAKLLADLGADTVRPEPPQGDPLRHRGPRAEAGGGSLWHAFFASSRRFLKVDLDTPQGTELLRRLIDRADIVLACDGAFGVAEAALDAALERRPRCVVVHVSSFSQDGPWRGHLAPDLVAGALGGAVATTGDADTPPLKAFGELNFMLSGIYAAIAALASLHHARETGVGQRVRVPVHECIASCLEQVFMWYWYGHALPVARGPVLERRGSRHWTNAYEVMAARNGSVMVTPVPDFDAQLAWLLQHGVGEDLLDPALQDPADRTELIARMMEALRGWVATQDAGELFHAAQSRHLPYGRVSGVAAVADNPQLRARDWWAEYPAISPTARGPGAPYRFTETPWALAPQGDVEADTQALLEELGWQGEA